MNRLRHVDGKSPGADGESLRRVHPSVWRHFTAHPDARLQMIVSLDTPQPDLSDMIGGGALHGPDELPKPDPSLIDRIAASVRKALAELGVEILNWLPNSQGFVVELTAEQTRRVCEIAGILEIIPNERLK